MSLLSKLHRKSVRNAIKGHNKAMGKLGKSHWFKQLNKHDPATRAITKNAPKAQQALIKAEVEQAKLAGRLGDRSQSRVHEESANVASQLDLPAEA